MSRPDSSQASSAATSDVEEAEGSIQEMPSRKRGQRQATLDSKRVKESGPTNKRFLHIDEIGFENCIEYVFKRYKPQEGKPDESMRCLYYKVCSCVADILCDRLVHIKETTKFCKPELMPYKGVSEEDLSAVERCSTVISVMDILRILDKWLNTSSLDFFIFTSTEPHSLEERRASYWLNQYNSVLDDFCCRFLMNELPGEFDKQLNNRGFVRMKHHSTLTVQYKHDFANFTLADLRKETAFLEKVLDLPPEVIIYLQSEESNSTTVYWAFDMSYVVHMFSMSDVRQLFWKLLEHSILSLKLKGVISISLRGRHASYLIKNALQTGQNLIQQTEVCACCIYSYLRMNFSSWLYSCVYALYLHRYSPVSFMLWLDWE